MMADSLALALLFGVSQSPLVPIGLEDLVAGPVHDVGPFELALIAGHHHLGPIGSARPVGSFDDEDTAGGAIGGILLVEPGLDDPGRIGRQRVTEFLERGVEIGLAVAP
jgi:hypothetical protein